MIVRVIAIITAIATGAIAAPVVSTAARKSPVSPVLRRYKGAPFAFRVTEGSLGETAQPDLGPLLGVDLVAALTSATLLSPFVTIIDKSITMAAAGSKTLGAAMQSNVIAAGANPLKFVSSPEYLYITGVYFATYACANTIETIFKQNQRPTAIPKLVGTTTANIVTCVAKDAAFARMFGSKAAAAVPKRSLALFSARDGLTVFASFIFPPQLAQAMMNVGVNAGRALNSAQLACPVAVQLISTPIHLLGLDFYNRAPGSINLANGDISRLRACFKNYVPVAGARMIRVLPAFGIGGIGNRMLRSRGNEMLRSINTVRDT